MDDFCKDRNVRLHKNIRSEMKWNELCTGMTASKSNSALDNKSLRIIEVILMFVLTKK